MNKCAECNKSANNKFCSISCSNVYNNRLRKFTCKICNIDFDVTKIHVILKHY